MATTTDVLKAADEFVKDLQPGPERERIRRVFIYGFMSGVDAKPRSPEPVATSKLVKPLVGEKMYWWGKFMTPEMGDKPIKIWIGPMTESQILVYDESFRYLSRDHGIDQRGGGEQQAGQEKPKKNGDLQKVIAQMRQYTPKDQERLSLPVVSGNTLISWANTLERIPEDKPRIVGPITGCSSCGENHAGRYLTQNQAHGLKEKLENTGSGSAGTDKPIICKVLRVSSPAVKVSERSGYIRLDGKILAKE